MNEKETQEKATIMKIVEKTSTDADFSIETTASSDEISANMTKYMISIIERIQQRILHHEGLANLKAVDASNVVEKFDKFMSEFFNVRNATNRHILDSLVMNENESDDIIEVDNDGFERKFSKKNDDAKIIEEKDENENEDEDEDEDEDEEKDETMKSEIIEISD